MKAASTPAELLSAEQGVESGGVEEGGSDSAIREPLRRGCAGLRPDFWLVVGGRIPKWRWWRVMPEEEGPGQLSRKG